MPPSISQRIATELGVQERQVTATVDLLESGSTVPFIARYRKEATGGLDDTQLRKLEERLRYLRELEDRRQTIIGSVRDQGKLTPDIESQLQEADSKARLEDLYLPYKPKRRTKAQIAREAGLEPLATALFADPALDPENLAAAYVDVDKGVADVKAALDGARQILIERFAEDAELVGGLRAILWERGIVRAKQAEGKAEAGAKFRDYFDFAEPVAKIPSHRALALFRGRKEEVLLLSLDLDEPEERGALGTCERQVAKHFGIADRGRPGDRWLLDTARWAWRVRISLHLEAELMQRLWEMAETEAIRVFAANLRDLLLAAPAGPKTILGLDPGFRTGVKVAIVDATGKMVETATLYPHEPHRRWEESLAALAALSQRHKVELIAIGNGTASRETDKLAIDLQKRFPELKLRKAMVSEAGASVYSASEYAAKEFPDLDVTLRGAVSIARRLQDPLAELVKIDPKSIGVGQYQHDIGEGKLSRSLDAVVEDCVNAVGVDLNTASIPLLAQVSGLNQALAGAVVAWRDSKGRFIRRRQLLDVPRLGPKAFEQCAGFLKIMDGEDPLDASAVHPEAYPVVRRICDYTGQPVTALIGNSAALRQLDPQDFTDSQFGLPTVRDIFAELEKPGRDPRGEFTAAAFRDGVETLKDLAPGMRLEGVVTNVTNFGAFVDIGVHQDGLVHVSALADRFVQDPHKIVKPGQIVQVKVLEVDIARKRIALTMRLGDAPTRSGSERAKAASKPDFAAKSAAKPAAKPAARAQPGGNAMALALQRAALAKENKR